MKNLLAFVLVAACLGCSLSFGQTKIDLSRQKGAPPPVPPVAISANTTLGTTQSGSGRVILASAGANGITLTLPTAVGISGTTYTVKKVDAAAGVVTIDPFGSQTIDWDVSMLLVNQWQFVRLISDGANWLIYDATP